VKFYIIRGIEDNDGPEAPDPVFRSLEQARCRAREWARHESRDRKVVIVRAWLPVTAAGLFDAWRGQPDSSEPVELIRGACRPDTLCRECGTWHTPGLAVCPPMWTEV